MKPKPTAVSTSSFSSLRLGLIYKKTLTLSIHYIFVIFVKLFYTSPHSTQQELIEEIRIASVDGAASFQIMDNLVEPTRPKMFHTFFGIPTFHGGQMYLRRLIEPSRSNWAYKPTADDRYNEVMLPNILPKAKNTSNLLFHKLESCYSTS
ncbi:hypothetical protein [Shewanella sp. UCD-KL12]|uniref:hypothetical protein n=1 Tax=Shewanella sp. UCD-KL12 TaxID=1917163 RepID=UPI00097045CF|nr:hypothetical protein [Shewanella sp. UCD-KL12]